MEPGKKQSPHLRWLILILLAVCCLGLVGLVRSNQEGFTGSRVKNPDAYLLDIQRMNGTDLHALELQAGDALQIHFETVRGKMHLEIKAPDGTTLYRGNGKETKDFTLNITQSGAYPVVVEAQQGKGTIEIRIRGKQ